MDSSTPFNGSSGVYNWLSRFVNFERGQTLKNFCLDRMITLAEICGRPEKCAPAFHVAGSKGKGSVTGMIASILEASGIKTASYASPHVSDFRERLTLGGRFFDEDIYARAGTELRKIIEGLEKSSYSALNGEEPSFFELLTLWFFLCAKISRCEAMAVETGMGGRLDATNILEPLVSVITVIELEHTEYLGTTIQAIAGEKAGIIKPGHPLVLAAQTQEALKVFSGRAASNNSPLFYFPDNAEIKNLSVSREGTTFTLILKNRKGIAGEITDEVINDLFIPIPGGVQAHNAGLAALAVKTAYPDTKNEAIRNGLANFTLPARFERISDMPLLVIDGAHTGQSMALCVKTFACLYGSGGILLFGCVAGKDIRSMAETCVPYFSTIVITTPGTFKLSRPEEVFDVFKEEIKNKSIDCALLFVPETEKAIDQVMNMALDKGLPVLGAGSFYLAAEIRNHLYPTVQ